MKAAKGGSAEACRSHRGEKRETRWESRVAAPLCGVTRRLEKERRGGPSRGRRRSEPGLDVQSRDQARGARLELGGEEGTEAGAGRTAGPQERGRGSPRMLQGRHRQSPATGWSQWSGGETGPGDVYLLLRCPWLASNSPTQCRKRPTVLQTGFVLSS